MGEDELRALHAAGELDAVCTRALEEYGPEVYGFLLSQLRQPDDAAEVFADFSEDLWRGLGAFEWRCSLRAWMYTLARHAAIRLRTRAHRAPGRNQPLSQAREVAERVRSRTATFLRSETRAELERLRRELDPDEQALLTLRIDRKLEWGEIARVLAPPDSALDDEMLAQESARWRKRFQWIKDKLRASVRDGG